MGSWRTILSNKQLSHPQITLVAHPSQTNPSGVRHRRILPINLLRKQKGTRTHVVAEFVSLFVSPISLLNMCQLVIFSLCVIVFEYFTVHLTFSMCFFFFLNVARASINYLPLEFPHEYLRSTGWPPVHLHAWQPNEPDTVYEQPPPSTFLSVNLRGTNWLGPGGRGGEVTPKPTVFAASVWPYWFFLPD